MTHKEDVRRAEAEGQTKNSLLVESHNASRTSFCFLLDRVEEKEALPESHHAFEAATALACEQALRCALAAGREKEGELATKSLEFEYLHRKSRCEMLIGGDDTSNDVITFGMCFSMFVYIRARFRFALIGGNLTAQSTGSRRPREMEVEFKF